MNEVFFEKDLVSSLLNKSKKYSSSAIVVDATVYTLYKKKLQKLFSSLPILQIPSGEKYKNRISKEKIEDFLFSLSVDRQGVIIAIGGGALLDLAGFTASTYLRGIDYISVPTTFLAMVDAAHGGKTAINTPNGKNTIGAFHDSASIFIDPNFLCTLSNSQMLEGLSEVIKKALIADEKLFLSLDKSKEIWDRRENDYLLFLVKKSIFIKKYFVDQDKKDRGVRAVLNFGHTMAHAIELASNFSISHGKAVALGILGESYISYLQKLLNKDFLEKISMILDKYNMIENITEKIKKESFLQALQKDKKNQKKNIHCILLQDIGRFFALSNNYSHEVKKEDFEKAFYFMSQFAQETEF